MRYNGAMSPHSRAQWQIQRCDHHGPEVAQYAYDTIKIQEDFHYHDKIYAADSHSYLNKTSGDVPFGSGLSTLSNYPFSNLDRVTLDKCYIADGDCLTPNGFTVLTLELADGI